MTLSLAVLYHQPPAPLARVRVTEMEADHQA